MTTAAPTPGSTGPPPVPGCRRGPEGSLSFRVPAPGGAPVSLAFGLGAVVTAVTGVFVGMVVLAGESAPGAALLVLGAVAAVTGMLGWVRARRWGRGVEVRFVPSAPGSPARYRVLRGTETFDEGALGPGSLVVTTLRPREALFDRPTGLDLVTRRAPPELATLLRPRAATTYRDVEDARVGIVFMVAHPVEALLDRALVLSRALGVSMEDLVEVDPPETVGSLPSPQ